MKTEQEIKTAIAMCHKYAVEAEKQASYWKDVDYILKVARDHSSSTSEYGELQAKIADAETRLKNWAAKIEEARITSQTILETARRDGEEAAAEIKAAAEAEIKTKRDAVAKEQSAQAAEVARLTGEKATLSKEVDALRNAQSELQRTLKRHVQLVGA